MTDNALQQLLGTGITHYLDDNSQIVDEAGLKKFLKKVYRTQATLLHTDQNSGSHDAFAQVSTGWGVIDKAGKDQLQAIVDNYIAGQNGGGGDEELLAAAMMEIEDLEAKLEEAQKETAAAQAELVRAYSGGGGAVDPHKTIVYQDGARRITLASAQTDIGRIVRNEQDARSQLANQRDTVRKLGEERARYKSRADSLEARMSTVKGERDQAIRLADGLATDVKRYQRQVQAAEAQVKEAEARYHKARADLTQEQARTRGLEGNLAATTQSAETLLHSQRQSYEAELQRAQETHEQELAQTRRVAGLINDGDKAELAAYEFLLRKAVGSDARDQKVALYETVLEGCDQAAILIRTNEGARKDLSGLKHRLAYERNFATNMGRIEDALKHAQDLYRLGADDAYEPLIEKAMSTDDQATKVAVYSAIAQDERLKDEAFSRKEVFRDYFSNTLFPLIKKRNMAEARGDKSAQREAAQVIVALQPNDKNRTYLRKI